MGICYLWNCFFFGEFLQLLLDRLILEMVEHWGGKGLTFCPGFCKKSITYRWIVFITQRSFVNSFHCLQNIVAYFLLQYMFYWAFCWYSSHTCNIWFTMVFFNVIIFLLNNSENCLWWVLSPVAPRVFLILPLSVRVAPPFLVLVGTASVAVCPPTRGACLKKLLGSITL